MHTQTKTDSKTLGGPLSANKGIYAQKKEKKRGKGGKKRDGKN